MDRIKLDPVGLIKVAIAFGDMKDALERGLLALADPCGRYVDIQNNMFVNIFGE